MVDQSCAFFIRYCATYESGDAYQTTQGAQFKQNIGNVKIGWNNNWSRTTDCTDLYVLFKVHPLPPKSWLFVIIYAL